jgi:hypothetical protein
MQACLWLQDGDVTRLARLPVVKDRLAKAWRIELQGAMAAACVAKTLITVGIEVHYPNSDVDVDDGIDLLVPSFPEIGSLAIQVKSAYRSETRIILIRDADLVCRRLGLARPEDDSLMNQISSIERKVKRLNARIGAEYSPMLVVVGGLDTDRPMSETVKALAGDMPQIT